MVLSVNPVCFVSFVCSVYSVCLVFRWFFNLMLREVILSAEFGCCGYEVLQCCSEIQVLRCCSAAVLRSEGSRDEGRGKKQEEGVGSKQ